MRTLSRLAMIVGAAGSVAMMLYVGRFNQSSFLMFLFAGWVTLPFVATAWADRASVRWTATAQATVQVLGLTFAVASLGVFGYVTFVANLVKPAAPFLLLPLAQLVVLGAVALSRRGKINTINPDQAD